MAEAAARVVIGAEPRGGAKLEARRAMEAGGEARAGLGLFSRFRSALGARGLQDISGDGGVRKQVLRPGTGQPVPPAATVAGTVPTEAPRSGCGAAVPRGAAGRAACSPAPRCGGARSIWPCGSRGRKEQPSPWRLWVLRGPCRSCPPLGRGAVLVGLSVQAWGGQRPF